MNSTAEMECREQCKPSKIVVAEKTADETAECRTYNTTSVRTNIVLSAVCYNRNKVKVRKKSIC